MTEVYPKDTLRLYSFVLNIVINTLPMSVKLKELFILDLQKIAMEILLQIIPNTPKVVHNTPRSIRFRKISFSERDKKVISTYVP